MEEEKKEDSAGINQSNPTTVETAVVQSVPSKSNKLKRLNWKKIFFAGLSLLIIILIVLILADVIKLKPTGTGSGVTTKEFFNVSYKIYDGNNLLEEKTIAFEKGKISSLLNLESSKLDEEIKKMSVGEEKNITLEAKEAYGEYDPQLKFSYPRVEKQNRTNEINRTMWISISDFATRFEEQPVLNQEYNLSGAPWSYKVIELNSSNVKLSQQAALNQEIPLGLFTYKVISLTEEMITLRIFGNDTIIPSETGDYMINLTENEIIKTLIPELGQEMELTGYPKAKVVSINATDMILDANDPNAGKTITIQVKLLDKKTEKVPVTGSAIKHIEGAPTLQFFIMSHCPYGTQMAKGVIPAWEKFINKANIELRFVSYTMHGAQEDLDNNRLICIREEQSEKLINYLKCFVYGDGSESSSQACIDSTGIDKTKLETCLENNVNNYMEEDKTLNTQYGVQGSPTVIIDGKEASIYPRDPANVAKALCDAFKGSKPSECSFAFDTTNPSPGFGGGSGSSTSGGSCG